MPQPPSHADPNKLQNSSISSKGQWREWANDQRRQLLTGYLGASPGPTEAVCAGLREFLAGRGVRRVLAYHALPGEPDVAGLEPDFELFTTRTRFRPQRHLTLHPYASATERSKAGYWQPPADAPQVALESIQAVLVPGLAYDHSGTRLGYGGGFYDRLLPGYAGLLVGVAWSPLVVTGLPREPHDCQVQWLATEQGMEQALAR